MNLHPLPSSIEDLFNVEMPCPFASPPKSEPSGECTLRMIPRMHELSTSSALFEPISDEEGNISLEPVPKRLKAADGEYEHFNSTEGTLERVSLNYRGNAEEGNKHVDPVTFQSSHYGGISEWAIEPGRVIDEDGVERCPPLRVKRSLLCQNTVEDGNKRYEHHSKRRQHKSKTVEADEVLKDIYSGLDDASALPSQANILEHGQFGPLEVAHTVDLHPPYLAIESQNDNIMNHFEYDSSVNVPSFHADIVHDNDFLRTLSGHFLDADEFLSSAATSISGAVDHSLSWMDGVEHGTKQDVDHCLEHDSSGEFVAGIVANEFNTTPPSVTHAVKPDVSNASTAVQPEVASTTQVTIPSALMAVENNFAVTNENCPSKNLVCDKAANKDGDTRLNADAKDIATKELIGDFDDEDDAGTEGTDNPSGCQQAYDILDDLEEGSDDVDDDQCGGDGGSSDDESDSEKDVAEEEMAAADVVVPEEEIEAMLEEGVQTKYPSHPIDGGLAAQPGTGIRVRGAAAKRRFKNALIRADGGDTDFEAPNIVEKLVLVDKAQDPFDILPAGWISLAHTSGMTVYLHKPTRVCSMSRPYFIGRGSIRKHDIPLSAVPCLQYKRAAEEKTKAEQVNTCPVTGSSSEAIVSGVCDKADTSAQQVVTSTTSDPSNGTNDRTVEDVSSSKSHPEKTFGQLDVKVQSVEENRKATTISPLEFREYCRRLFEFKTISVRRFSRWKDRRRHNLHLRRALRPTLPPTTKLITCPLPAPKEAPNARKKAFILNPAGKSDVSILHEYSQHAMKIQPKYVYEALDNSTTPYSATVIINDVQYGTGAALSKKQAKLEAARVALRVLIPDMNKVTNADEKMNMKDLAFFDEITIEDPRVNELCIKAGQPTPYQILTECLKRNYGMGDTQIKTSMRRTRHQKSIYTMTVGKHEASVVCKNKRDGKQQASQAMLQLMHKHVTSWGSLLRLYAKTTEAKEKKEEEHSITVLQTRAEPNKAILSKLKEEMTKLYIQKSAINSKLKGTINFEATALPSSDLGNVEF